MKKSALMLLVVLTAGIWLVSSLQAGIKNRVFSLHLDLYGVQPALNDSAQIWLFSPYLGGDFQFMLSPQTALVASVRTGRIYNDSISTSIFKFNNDRANRRWNVTSVAFGPKFYLNRRSGTTPYFLTRLEMLLWSIRSYPSDKPIVIENGAGTPRDYKATELGFTAGFGLEQLFADRFAFSIGAEFTYLTGIGADFSQWVKNSRSRAILQFGAGISIHFGKKGHSLLEQTAKVDRERGRVERKVYEGDVTMGGDTNFVDQSLSEAPIDTASTIHRQEAVPEVDEDLDGVVDTLDKCADTPIGVVVDRDGCPLDSDHDGVPDYLDQCPDSNDGVAVDSNGCLLDSDHDGIENVLDQCPDTPPKLPVDQRGCPDRAIIFTKRVYHELFNSGEVKIRPEQAAALDSVVELLKMFADVSVMIYGYTDNVGPDDSNLQLSQKRADALKSYFVAAGVEKGRLLAIGRGESNFIASNRTRPGRELNRRIELEFKF